MIGYRIVNVDTDGNLVSQANSRLKLPPIIGKVHNVKMWVTTKKDHALNYYSNESWDIESGEPEQALLTYEFEEDDIISGDPNDNEPELNIKKGKLKDIKYLSTLLENISIKWKKYWPDTLTLQIGTPLYHGTNEDFDTLDFPAWFSTSYQVAKHFGEIVWEFNVSNPIELPKIVSRQEMSKFQEVFNMDEFYGTEDMIEQMKKTNLPGWIIPNNYNPGDDILLMNDNNVSKVVSESYTLKGHKQKKSKTKKQKKTILPKYGPVWLGVGWGSGVDHGGDGGGFGESFKSYLSKVINENSVKWAVGDNEDKATGFTSSFMKRPENTIIWMDIEKVFALSDRNFKLDVSDETGGENAIDGRISRAKNHWKDEKFMNPSEISVDENGSVHWVDGRHRQVAAYQLGKKYGPFVVNSETLRNLDNNDISYFLHEPD